MTKKASGKGGEGGTGSTGSAGAGGGTKPERVFEIGGACTDRRMLVEIDKKTYPIDCDVWRAPNAVFRVFDALDKCCTPTDKANELYDSFTPQGKLLYEIIAVLHQQDADNDLITVDLPGTLACEAAVNAALPTIALCKGGVDVNAVLSACASFVFGKIQPGAKCPDTDSCLSPASCLGADASSKALGVCTAPGAQGAVCANSLEQPKNGTPQHPLCAAGLVCSSGKCNALATDGGDCKLDNACASGRCASGKCAAALAQKMPLGGACTAANDCETIHRCVGGICEDKLEGGKACAPQGDDCRVFCDKGVCSGLFCGIDRF